MTHCEILSQEEAEVTENERIADKAFAKRIFKVFRPKPSLG